MRFIREKAQHGRLAGVGILKGYRMEVSYACGMGFGQDAVLDERDCRTGFE
jgi:hypothetical protein